MRTLTKKEKRTFDAEVHYIFTPKAFMKYPGKDFFEDVSRLAHLFPCNGKTLFLSDRCLAAYKKISEILAKHKTLTAHVSRHEIYSQVSASHKYWLEAGLEPDGDEFLSRILVKVSENTKTYKFLVSLEGISLKDIDILELSSISLQRSNKSILKEIQLTEGESIEHVYEQIKSQYWLIGESFGSPALANERFEFTVKIAIGILAIYGVVLYEWAFLKTKIFAKLDAFEHRSAVTILRWDNGGGNLTTMKRFGDATDLSICKNTLSNLRNNYYFDRLVSLISIQSPTELQASIITAIYWFYDAYNDSNTTMKLIKLWSCSECFFTLDSDTISETNASGIAVIISLAGPEISGESNYLKLKSNIKKLYKFRSQAVHHGHFDKAKHIDINTMARWISWVIIWMVSLTDNGYTTLSEVKTQIDRLNMIYTNAPTE